MIRSRSAAAVLPSDLAQIELIDNLNHETRLVILGQPVIHRGWQQVRRVSIHRHTSCHSLASPVYRNTIID